MASRVDEHELDTLRPFRICWTRTDCARFERDGLLTPGGYELINGDIIRKMGQKRQPSGGTYQSITTHTEDESVAPLAAPESPTLIRTLLPQQLPTE